MKLSSLLVFSIGFMVSAVALAQVDTRNPPPIPGVVTPDAAESRPIDPDTYGTASTVKLHLAAAQFVPIHGVKLDDGGFRICTTKLLGGVSALA